MIDVKLLLGDFDAVAKQLSIKKVDSKMLENLRDLAQDFKNAKQNLEFLQAFQNKASKEFGELMRQKDTKASELKIKLDKNKSDIASLQDAMNAKEAALNQALFNLPNLPDEFTPLGEDERDNVEIKRILEPREFDFKPLEHWELATKNGWIDFERGVKLAKSRFSLLRGMGARLNRALINFMLDFNQLRGFEQIATPLIVNQNILFGTGQLPKFENDMFKLSSESTDFDGDMSQNAGNDFYLISTAEITLTNIYNDEIIRGEDLPIKMCAYTPCFRKEAGSAGRDTRGMIRQHQFDKVELVALTHPKDSENIKQKMIDSASSILSALKLPHRLVQLCGGDLGFSASNTIDIEVWLPGQNCYREISSISNCRDFQARRAKIRYKDEKGKNNLVHTLNGSSLAVGRTLVAIMENYQQKNGEIEIPEVLKKYL